MTLLSHPLWLRQQQHQSHLSSSGAWRMQRPSIQAARRRQQHVSARLQHSHPHQQQTPLVPMLPRLCASALTWTCQLWALCLPPGPPHLSLPAAAPTQGPQQRAMQGTTPQRRPHGLLHSSAALARLGSQQAVPTGITRQHPAWRSVAQ
jgi:hypothetical protein